MLTSAPPLTCEQRDVLDAWLPDDHEASVGRMTQLRERARWGWSLALSYLIEGIRSFYVTGIDGEALALAFGISALLIAVFLSLAAASLRTTLVRT